MGKMTVGIRDLKARLSEYLRQMQRGQTILIGNREYQSGLPITLTDHGQPVGRILPVERDLQEKIADLQAAGLLAWNGQRLPSIEAPVINRSGKLISDLIVEMREADE